MRDLMIDPQAWMDELPVEHAGAVVPPEHFEQHVDGWAHARKVVGRDHEGQRCYVLHEHTEVEERFDIDEFPLRVAVGRERRVAWRLRSGQWLLQIDRVDRLDGCRPRCHHQAPTIVSIECLGC